MNKIRPLFHFLRRHTSPLVLLAVTLLAYAWQITSLGFFWDDWVFVGRFQNMGILNTIFYGDTRQLGVYALMPGFLLAGDSPLLWHLYSLLLRWAVTLLFCWALNKLWPGQKTAVTLMAALFAVHPAFSQQSISVVYSLQFVDYAIFLLSIGLTINSERAAAPGRHWLWLGLALLAQALHLFVVEYFVGLELIRPLVIYFLQGQGSRDSLSKSRRLRRAFVCWLPYLLVMILYAVWRSGALGGGFATYDYKTITALLRSDPRAAVLETLEYGMKDILVLLVSTWHATLTPTILDLTQPFNLFSLAVAVFAAAGIYFALTRQDFDPAGGEARFLRQAALLGLFAVLVSFIPAWFVRRHIVEPGNFGDRFALPGLFGASILLVALAQFFAGQRKRGILLSAIFIGLAVGAQMRFENNYRWDWERQLRTYWQVYWRAPALQPGTVLVGYDAISMTTVNYVGGFALDNFYHPPQTPASPAVWYVNYPKTTIPANLEAFLAGTWHYTDTFDNIIVKIGRANSLALDYTEGRCLKILTADDQVNYNLPEDFRAAAGFSNPALALPQAARLPAQYIFGAEPRPTWCTYYQKAELARQSGDWPGIIALKKEADKAGLQPMNAYELFPFIEAYAMRTDWANAQKLSLQALKSLSKTQDGLCLIWQRVGDAPPAGYAAAFQQVNQQLLCH